MTTVKDIEKAISKLPDQDLTSFRNWFERFDAKRWDAQFEQDVSVGKLDALAKKVIANHKQGKSQLL